MNIEEFAFWLINNYGWITLIMVGLVAGLVEILKLPYKKLTSKISNERIRKLANKFIILFSFGIAFLIRYLGSIWLSQFITFEPVLALCEGSFANIIYALSEGIISNSSVKTLSNTIKDVADDGVIDDAEIDKVKSEVDKATKKEAENLFKDIINKK